MTSPDRSTNITRITAIVRGLAIAFAMFSGNQLAAQYSPLSQSEAMAEMQRFSSGKRVLYLAAHPDDENTRLIAWLSNALDAETTYLSLTKGSGGQNLLGDELGENLGVIREHELRAARSIDGGNQRFTDALDFGYSKSVDEVWTKWNHEDLVRQVVHEIRELQPDFILTRFPPDSRAGHGHHTASAELAIECAKLAGDSTYMTSMPRWEVGGVWWNTSIWWDKTLKDDPEVVHLDLSGFDPLHGDSYGAIGDAARSMHKCQGFGVPINRGPREEYFKKLWGEADLESYLGLEERATDQNSRLAQDASFALEIGDQDQAIAKWAVLGRNILEHNSGLSNRYQRWQQVMLHLTGLYAEYYTSSNPLPSDAEFKAMVEIQAMSSGANVYLASLRTSGKQMALNPPQLVGPDGIQLEVELNVVKANPAEVTDHARVRLEIGEEIFMIFMKPIAKLSDRAIGEYREEVAIDPLLHSKFDQSVYWNNGKKSLLGYSVYARKDGIYNWTVSASLPSEQTLIWEHSVSGNLKEGWNHFEETVPAKLPLGRFEVSLSTTALDEAGLVITKRMAEKHTISYPHVGTHYRYRDARSTLSVLDLSSKRIKVGYIEGAGDQMDETLESVGYDVIKITEETPELWEVVDAVLVGIRAFNTEPWLMKSQERIASYVKAGGNFVVTYTTAGRSGVELPLPVPLTIGRDRVTEEYAPVSFVSHPLTMEPNKISNADFEQWVQERGLYFPVVNESYTTIFSIEESTGIIYPNSTVVADFGKGSVIYTGLSLFRELPAGVPGALRVLQNILHYDH